MALSDDEKYRLRAAAKAEGVDPDALIAAAESGDDSPKGESSGKGMADRLLIGFLDYVKVKELRDRLGFSESIADDDMTCTAYSIKNGLKPDPTKSTAPPTATGDGEA